MPLLPDADATPLLCAHPPSHVGAPLLIVGYTRQVPVSKGEGGLLKLEFPCIPTKVLYHVILLGLLPCNRLITRLLDYKEGLGYLDQHTP